MSNSEPPSRKEKVMTPDAREHLARELGEEWLQQHEFFLIHQMDKQTAVELTPWFKSIEQKSS